MKPLLLFFVFTSTSLLYSQNSEVTVTGTVTDSETNTPLEYATISVFNVNSEEAIDGVITDSNGEFSIELTKGNYDFKVEFISFKIKYYRNTTVNNPLSLGTIELSIDENILDEIEVIGEKTEIEIKLDKTVYNIGKDLTLKGSSVSSINETALAKSITVPPPIPIIPEGKILELKIIFSTKLSTWEVLGSSLAEINRIWSL